MKKTILIDPPVQGRDRHRRRHPERRLTDVPRRTSFTELTDTVFVIPTYRLRDVAETIEIYDQHAWSNGHSVKMMIFDAALGACGLTAYDLLARVLFKGLRHRS